MLRTISLRLVGTEAAKAELEELGEDTEGMITTVSKLRDTILSATSAATSDGKGFDILDENGNYKSTYEIMQGLADLYDEIVAKDKELGTNNLNLLIESIAGKNRSNIAASILKNGDMLASVYKDAQNSDGSAQEELDKYLDSIDGKMAKLENQAQEFWFKLIDSETIKGGIDLLTKLFELLTKITDSLGIVGTVTTVAGGLMGIKGSGFVNYDAENGSWTTLLSNARKIPEITAECEEAFKKLTKVNIPAVKNFDKLAEKVGYADASFVDFLKNTKYSEKTLDNYQKYLKETTSATFKFGASLKSAATNIGIMLAINIAIKAATALWDKFNTTVSEAQSDLNETQTTIKELKAEIEELKSIDEDALTQGQKDRLENLEKQLEVQQQLEEIEKRRLAREKLGTGNWADRFDKESFAYAKNKISDSMGDYDQKKGSAFAKYEMGSFAIDDIRKQIEQAKTQGESEGYIQGLEEKLVDGETKQQGNVEDINTLYGELLSTRANILSWQSWIQSMIDDGTLIGSDLTTAYNELAWLEAEMSRIQGEMDYINKLVYGGASDWKSLISEKVANYSVDDLLHEFSEEDLIILATLEFDKEATIGDLRELLNNLSDEAKSNTSQVSFGNIFANEYAEGNLTNLGKISESIDTIQNAYKTLNEAIDEYNNTGAISIDTLQSVTALGDNWLDYLVDEQGNLKLDKQALQELTISRLEDMRMQTINNLIDNVSKIESDIAAKQYLISTNYAEAESYEAVAQASLAAAETKMLDAGVSKTNVAAVINKATADISKINALFDNTNISYSSIIGDDSKSKTQKSKAEKSWKDYLDKCINVFEKELELGLMDYDDFIQKSRKLTEDFYKDGKISAEEYWKAIEDLYEKQLDIYDKVLNAVERRFDKEIEKIQNLIDGLEDQNDVLEKQIDDYDKILSVVDTVYDDQIKALEDEKDLLQDKIDAINDEADAYELVRRKEEALYALEKAQKNKTKKLYVEDRGYIYDTDHEAIREAQDEVHDIKNEEVIRKLEKEQEAIDKSIEILEEYKKLWGSVSDAYETEINKQLAIALWGEEYESVILSNRIEDITAFKDQYIAAQQQIDSNQSLIDSYNEKIEYYEALKEQWADIANAYEQSIEDQYAAMILGEDWERTILDERNGLMENFKNKYIEIQKQITEAARSSAEAQKKAAQDALDATKTLGSVNTDVPKTEKKYRVVDSKGNVVSSGYKTQDAANEYIIKAAKNNPKNRTLKVESYSRGGVVSDGAKFLQTIAKSVGEDQMIAVKTGERVLTERQNELWEKWTNSIPDMLQFSNTVEKFGEFDYSKFANLMRPNQSQNVEQHFHVTLPNIHDGSSATQLMRELQRLPLDAYQYSMKR